MMHGGGTSVYPHCRPLGLRGPKPREWEVKLNYDPQNKGQWVTLIEHYTIMSDTEPTKEEVYKSLEEKLNAKLK